MFYENFTLIVFKIKINHIFGIHFAYIYEQGKINNILL
ncbi:hypothetical protein CSCA_1458 [Clostridium scatologenes]|uniref:Uncharacterized protein n=1 Tax=Clostridium scatologenes TaxID=1548 RepID=A0A0E3JZR7_CLOSL|nr:hypothetical protein CSCA_1458 [Clostridium scatologenes]